MRTIFQSNGSEIIRPLNQNRANIFSDLYYNVFITYFQFYMISSHDETQPETPPTLAAVSPSSPSSPPPSSTISVEGSIDGIVKERIKKRKRTRKTDANPDYDQTQKKRAHFPPAYEGTRTTSMSLRCAILTTRAVQGKRLLTQETLLKH
ncbi:hypothetical protein ABEB36_008711 [Hypothenemus hampei]|uniref:Uncharacterized protein n=1 Tax=Hypothenemus hampei TaxID=57062 RepID=A0ABD1EMU3_HYPHA